MAEYWFDRTREIVSNHLIAVPDPCVMLVRNVSIIPVEVVVRGYIAGSAWRDYEMGRTVSGHQLPRGLKQFERLNKPIVTPFTKEAVGKHDQPISHHEVLASGLVERDKWEQICDIAIKLFELATSELAGRGLIFADTKYEFGLLDGQIVLADEIHTLDSSRFWVQESYQDSLSRGEAPQMLDKEPIRRLLIERGFMGEGEVPLIDDSYRLVLRKHYADSAERITGKAFVFDDSDPCSRIALAVKGLINK
jgi:phosphoribosylaminoimidazole-succinocarboxamide synthase